ncbi:hypothetical protein AVEN_119431-1 [Araneus ventricosus]|uniref:RNase H type-1 domain-containing protein n=1 Tax=Araneus ventricosus TaxID=182803 RepID=A0A4Y2VDA8_ARAVE|nr:hypothetical protein AVEN_88762-1 [Araneus ventricosus]GBO22532.1 hypothetical protein AVEN_119431-1 [Araneus ventricosus]
MNKNILKIWYYTVIEKALLYGASVWIEALIIYNRGQIDRLHSIQRMFLLKFTRASRTSFTNVLNVLTGIPPLRIVAKAECIKFRVWVNRFNEYNIIVDINLLDKYMPFKNIPSRQRLINLDTNIPNSDYEIYTDGSRFENEIGFAVCILKHETDFQKHLFKLNVLNSVFQAELAAIEFAVYWAVKEKVKVTYILIASLQYLPLIAQIPDLNSLTKLNQTSLRQRTWSAFLGLELMWEFLETNWPINKPNWP